MIENQDRIKITIETKEGVVSINQAANEGTVFDVSDIFRQALLAMGFQPSTVAEAFNEDI